MTDAKWNITTPAEAGFASDLDENFEIARQAATLPNLHGVLAARVRRCWRFGANDHCWSWWGRWGCPSMIAPAENISGTYNPIYEPPNTPWNHARHDPQLPQGAGNSVARLREL
jgi:hypothetical protein